MATYNKITTGFRIGAADPVVSGIEDWIYIGNKGDFTFIYDPNNPLLVIGIRPIGGAQLFKFTGTNNSFSTSSKSTKTQVGPRYNEEIDFIVAGNDSASKLNINKGAYGRLFAIAVNNYKAGDSAIELYGAVCGLIFSDTERNSSDEAVEGGWKIKLTQPDKLREPFPPRSVFIPVSPVGISASVPTVGTARTATQIPSGVNATPSTTGGSLAAATYYFKVVSVDAQGVTIGSTEVNATTTGSTGSVAIGWTAAPGATSYRVYVGTAAGAESQYFTTTNLTYTYTGAAGTAGAVPGSGTAYTATATPSGVTATAAAGGSLANQTWYYKVTAVDALGETIGSTEASAATSGTNNSVNIAWSAAAGAVSYNVYRGAAAGAESIYFNTTALSFLDTGANLGATYANSLAVIESLVFVQ